MGSHGKCLRFKDVIQKDVRFKNASTVVFFVPHTSEYFAVSPLISELSERLIESGKRIIKEVRNDMRSRILRTTLKLSEAGASARESDVIEKLFRLEDTWIRLQRLTELIEKNPEGVILEMHALDRDYQENDKFPMADYFYRLPGTRVLVIRDALLEYIKPIQIGLDSIKNTKESEMIKCFRNIKFDEINAQYPSLRKILLNNKNRMAMIEIPAPTASPILRTGIRFVDNILLALQGFPRHLTKFEENYSLRSSERAAITEADIQGILKMISE